MIKRRPGGFLVEEKSGRLTDWRRTKWGIDLTGLSGKVTRWQKNIARRLSLGFAVFFVYISWQKVFSMFILGSKSGQEMHLDNLKCVTLDAQ